MKTDFASARLIARALGGSIRAAFEIEPLESRRLLAAAAAFDPTFGSGGSAAPLPVSAMALSAYNHLTPAGNGQFYAIDYDGEACYPSGYTAFQLLRVNADGSLDTSFGDGGGARVQRYDPTTLFGYEHFDYDSLLVGDVFAQADGRVLVSYRAVPPGSPDPWMLERFNNDGSVDESFGSNGTIEMPVSDYSQNVPTTLLQAGGKIEVIDANTVHDDGGAETITVRQFNSDGSPDETFGTDGVSVTSFSLATAFAPPTADEQAAEIARQSGWVIPNHSPGTVMWYTSLGGGAALADGSAALYLNESAGVSSTSDGVNTWASQTHIIALTLDATGQVSTTAVADEGTSTSQSPWEYRLGIYVQPDGKAIVSSTSDTGVTLSRLNPDGSTDSTFSAAELAIPGTTTSVKNVWFQPDGKLVVAVLDDSRELTGIVRLNGDGSADATFGGGQTIYGFGEHAAIGGILTNADGSMIVATDDAERTPFGLGDFDTLVTTPTGAQLVRLMASGGARDSYDDAGAEAAVQAAIAKRAADLAAAQAAQQAEYAAEYAAQQEAIAAQDAAQLAAEDASAADDGTADFDDGSTPDEMTSTDDSSFDLSGDPSAYGTGSLTSDPSDGFFDDADGTTVWNPDGTPQTI